MYRCSPQSVHTTSKPRAAIRISSFCRRCLLSWIRLLSLERGESCDEGVRLVVVIGGRFTPGVTILGVVVEETLLLVLDAAQPPR